MEISSNFDCGNIIVDQMTTEGSIQNAFLRIRKDKDSDFLQWYYFRISNVEGVALKLHIMNAGEAFSADGWKDYRSCFSYDRKKWYRCQTEYDGSKLVIDLIPEHSIVYFAYFPPFSYEQHLGLIGCAQTSKTCVASSIGRTVEGRDIDLLTIGKPSSGKKKVWILGKQHAGEHMASWFIKGMIERLLDENDPVSHKLLAKVVFYVIPSLNPDGSIAGHIRVNAAGRDLNREWNNPSKEYSPEVFFTKREMVKNGVDLCFDIHGDEELPYCFVSRIDGIPNFDERLSSYQSLFSEVWKKVSPDFQDEYGYQVDKPGKANLNICSKNIANTFNCLALTVEMPFKDNANLPDPQKGWSVERSENLGKSLLSALMMIIDDIK